jgi:hypothetical protein
MAASKCIEVLHARAFLRAGTGWGVFGFFFAMNLTLISAQELGTNASAGPLVRVATFNGSLYRDSAGMLASELERGNSEQAIGLAKILQTVRPDIVLVNEVDFEADHRAVRAFIERYLAVPQQTTEGKSLESLDYAHFFAAPVNTGVASGLDLSGDGNIGGPNDAWGYGKYEGQYGMVVLSRFPIAKADVRTFQKFLWKDLPHAKKPIVPNSGHPFYPEDIWNSLRLSSKSHWDVPVIIHGSTLHILASHPTPPAFDGPEDRNGCRNHDEIRFWTEYVSGSDGTGSDGTGRDDRSWLRDDQGKVGGLKPDASFVVVGDLNADPVDGSGIQQGIVDLLSHRRVFDPLPKSEGALEAASRLGKANSRQRGDAACDTSQFSPNGVGNLRVDYCLPSSNLVVEGSGVFWPAIGTEGAALVEVTDHRLVWCDIRLE